MASFKSATCAALALVSVVSAHFNLITPPTIGFSDDDEPTAPCGSFTPDFSNKDAITDFYVGGNPVGTNLFHAQANWLFRATLDQTASGNWTQLFPIIQQSGIGRFCEKAIPAPESWVGKQGVLSVVADAPDGLLYQCAIVNFVSGISNNFTNCENGTVQAAVQSDPALAALVGDASNATATATSSGASGAGTSATTTPTPTPTSKNGANGLSPAVGSLCFAAVLGVLGLALQ